MPPRTRVRDHDWYSLGSALSNFSNGNALDRTDQTSQSPRAGGAIPRFGAANEPPWLLMYHTALPSRASTVLRSGGTKKRSAETRLAGAALAPSAGHLKPPVFRFGVGA